jgi:hypothetical protein
MRLIGFLAAAALTVASVPTFAAPANNPAASLSLSAGDVRVGAPMKHSNKALALGAIVLIGVGAVGVVAGAVALSHNDSKAASA